MNVLGIDPSLTATGVCLPDGKTYTMKSRLKGDDRLESIYLRLLVDVEDHWPVDLAVIEDLPVNAKSAGLTGMAQGVIRMALASAGVPVARISPATLKKFATGKGNADKTAMLAATPDQYRGSFGDDNQVDAWWLREAGRAWLGDSPFFGPYQGEAVLDVLRKAKWPDPTEEVAA
ncbi:Holliday junction resolvasome RuvABC endonuclease subunit [Haloactinopolyspora alba]|uniref:Holliday junction resolvasome RuvABC endonuclease subunit n=1 Tax=Haloactinopolyspora alba TaxID=648780 RepID=A0A2P8E3X5_9ACTN|nr:crossover junction endodeoxyribonuclease RuvC [Haloactinopolyspora alba]PSL04156.1 Holliday junction resolvasome RuvABC endonuclease subunit [Haloactinopolyspora alba]